MTVVHKVVLSTNWKVGGSIPDFSSPHIEVSLGRILNPKLPLCIIGVCVCDSAVCIEKRCCTNVCKWVNVAI